MMVVAAMAAIAMTVWPGSAPSAFAQERPTTLFQFLFGNQPRRQEVRTPEAVQPRANRQPQRQSGTPQRREPAVQVVEKAEDAETVLVVGDFMGSGLAEGLEVAYAENPGIRIVSRANGSSGFVRDDFYDWPASIAGILDDVAPTVVVVMIGSNDRQQMRVEGNRETPLSEPWKTEYRERVLALAREIRTRDLPLVWVGMPSFRVGRMSSDMIAFNDIYRGAADEVGGVFVDIWDGFADENGEFVAEGPDMNGQPARLRAADGINLTAAGKRKIAFYTERPLNRILDEGGSSTSGQSGSDELAGPALPVEPRRIDRTEPAPLARLPATSEEELAGAAVTPVRATGRDEDQQGTRDMLQGATQGGRADDFTLRRTPSPAGTDRPVATP